MAAHKPDNMDEAAKLHGGLNPCVLLLFKDKSICRVPPPNANIAESQIQGLEGHRTECVKGLFNSKVNSKGLCSEWCYGVVYLSMQPKARPLSSPVMITLSLQ
jgi:hypothetical protein